MIWNSNMSRTCNSGPLNSRQVTSGTLDSTRTILGTDTNDHVAVKVTKVCENKGNCQGSEMGSQMTMDFYWSSSYLGYSPTGSK